MSKSFKTYLAIWAVSFAAYLVLVFSIGGQGLALLQEAAWPIYGFAIAAFLIQLACGYVTFRNDDLKRTFLGMPILTVSSAATVLLAVVSLVFTNIPVIPLWIGICVCCIILALSVIATIGAKASADYIETADATKVQAVSTIKTLTANASSLLAQTKSAEVRTITTKVYEVLRYSDPVSSSATVEVEQKLMGVFEEFKFAAKEENIADAETLAEELCNLVAERVEICKQMK